MTQFCKGCGRTESQISADAKTLGLLQELDGGVYTCCQISQWADEQRLAWFEAIQQNSKLVDDITGRRDFSEGEVVLVPVRLRRPQVPWYKSHDNIGRDE